MNWDWVVGLLTNGGVAALVGFFTSWRLNRARERLDYGKIKEIEHDTIDDRNREQYEEIMALRERMADMERALIRVRSCKHYATCPVPCELQKHKDTSRYFYKGLRQSRLEKGGERLPRDHTEGLGTLRDTDGKPP